MHEYIDQQSYKPSNSQGSNQTLWTTGSSTRPCLEFCGHGYSEGPTGT